MSGEESTSQHLAKAEAADLQLQRRARNEAQFTAGCGYGKRKVKLLEDFDLIVWPGLEKLGWTKVRCSTWNTVNFLFVLHCPIGSGCLDRKTISKNIYPN